MAVDADDDGEHAFTVRGDLRLGFRGGAARLLSRARRLKRPRGISNAIASHQLN